MPTNRIPFQLGTMTLANGFSDEVWFDVSAIFFVELIVVLPNIA
jgi:hypothetical protein